MGERARSGRNICCNEGGIEGKLLGVFIHCWYISIHLQWRKSPVELCLTQMCPLRSQDDGGTRQIRNRLQEVRKFDWTGTLIHKIWQFPAVTRTDVSVEEDGGVCWFWQQLTPLIVQQHNHVQGRGVNLFVWVNQKNINQQTLDVMAAQQPCHIWTTSNFGMKDFKLVWV